MIKIIPAILPQSYRAIEGGVEKVEGIVDTVQIDFVDGHFAPNRTWWFNNDEDHLQPILSEQEGLPHWDSMNYEFDLMVKDPIQYIDTFTMLGPSKITFHIEGLDEAEMLVYFEQLPGIVKETITFGMAIGLDTDPEMLRPYIDYITTIQCMGIARVGFQGQAYDARVIEQIKKVKALYPSMTIAVDGGVKLDTVRDLVQAGASELIVGSVVFGNPDPQGTIYGLQQLCQSATSTSEN